MVKCADRPVARRPVRRGGWLLILLILSALTVWPRAAAAADYRWSAPGGGNWNVATNWTPTGVPSTAADSAYVPVSGTAYTIDLNLNPSLRGLLLENPDTILELNGYVLTAGGGFVNHGVIASVAGATGTLSGGLVNGASGVLRVPANSVLQMVGARWVNDGRIAVHLGGAGAGYLRVQSHLTLGGGGRLDLQDAALALLDSPAGWVLTNEAGHTIGGAGALSAPLVNHGLVSADLAGQTLTLLSHNKTNDGTLRATGGGRLRLTSHTLTNAGGTVLADGDTIQLDNLIVYGGTFAGLGDGVVRTVGSVVLSDAAQSGLMEVTAGSVVTLTGSTLLNDGALHVWNGGASSAYLRLGAHVSLGGAGAVVLNEAAKAILDSPGGWILTNEAGHVIRGAGAIAAPVINHGLVSADRAGQTLTLQYHNKTNDGTLQATGGGRLRITGHTLTNAGGTVLAAGDTIQLDNLTVYGGTFAGLDDGVIRTVGPVVLSDAAQTGLMEVTAGSVVTLTGSTLVNDGVLHVWNGGASSAYLRMGAHVSAGGGGAILLGDGAKAILDSPGGWVLTNEAGHVIEGAGAISAPVVNHGLVSADWPGQILTLHYHNKTNDGTLQAVAGGVLRLSAFSLVNAGGTVLADDSEVQVQDMTVVGGALSSAGSGVVRMSRANILDGVRNAGAAEVADGSVCNVLGAPLTNDGSIVVCPGAATAAYLRVAGSTTLAGGGAIVLNSPTLAVLDSPGGWVLQNGGGHTIRGAGVVSAPLLNGGVVCADRPGGALRLTYFPKTNDGVFAARDGGRLKIEVAPSNYSAATRRLAGGTWLAADGGVIELPGCAVDSIAAAVVLDGAGSAVDLDASGHAALAGLARICPDGSLTLRNDAALAGACALVNAGRIVVGRGSTLTVAGASYTQAASGVFGLELAGTGTGAHGLLAVDGQAVIDGGLEVDLADGFVPAIGDSCVVMTFASRTGDFAAPGPYRAGDMLLETRWRDQALVLVVVGVSAAPDGPGAGDAAPPARLAFTARRTGGALPEFVLALPAPAGVEVAVFDIAGRRVARLADGPQAAGEHAFRWRGDDDAGRRLPSGVYIARAQVRADGRTVTRTVKTVLVR